MKKYLGIAAAFILSSVSYAAVTHFTETLPPATTAGCIPLSNGYDWSMTCNNPQIAVINLGSTTVAGSTTLTGTLTQTGGTAALNSLAKLVTPPTNYTTFFATNTVPVTGTYITILSSGSNLTLTGTPTIATTTILTPSQSVGAPGNDTNIADGTWLVLSSSSSQKILIQDAGTLSNSGLNLGLAGAEVVTSSRPITFIFNGSLGVWTQTSKHNSAF